MTLKISIFHSVLLIPGSNGNSVTIFLLFFLGWFSYFIYIKICINPLMSRVAPLKLSDVYIWWRYDKLELVGRMGAKG